MVNRSNENNRNFNARKFCPVSRTPLVEHQQQGLSALFNSIKTQISKGDKVLTMNAFGYDTLLVLTVGVGAAGAGCLDQVHVVYNCTELQYLDQLFNLLAATKTLLITADGGSTLGMLQRSLSTPLSDIRCMECMLPPEHPVQPFGLISSITNYNQYSGLLSSYEQFVLRVLARPLSPPEFCRALRNQGWVAAAAAATAATAVAVTAEHDAEQLISATHELCSQLATSRTGVVCPYSAAVYTHVGKSAGAGAEDRFVQWAEKALKSLDNGETVNLIIDCEGNGPECAMVQVAQAFPGTDLATSAPRTSQLLVPGSTFLIDMPASPAVKTAFGALLGHPRVVVVTCDCRGDYLLLDHFGGDLTASQPFDVQCGFDTPKGQTKGLRSMVEHHPHAVTMGAWKDWGHKMIKKANIAAHVDRQRGNSRGGRGEKTPFGTNVVSHTALRYAAGDVYMTAIAVQSSFAGTRSARDIVARSQVKVSQFKAKLRSAQMKR